MQRQFNSCLEQVSHEPELSQTREGLREVFVWVQEHTNLCLTVAGVCDISPDQAARLKERLRTSLERGTRLISEVMDGGTEPITGSASTNFSSMVSAGPSAGAGSSSVSAGMRRSPSAIPLSGVRRFDDGSAAAQAMNFPTALPRASLVSAGQSLAPQCPKGAPLPSRTYIKKSGS